jgi:cytochrome P450
MATVGRDIESVELTEEQLWTDGPPLEAFKEMRSRCPIHWTSKFELFPEEAGFWSVTTAEDVHTVSRDWQTYSSEAGGVLVAAAGFPLELAQAMFIGMDPPKHDRLKALFQAGFTPKRIAAHEDSIRAIARRVLDRLDGRETCDLVTDVAQPIVSRVIGSFMGISEEDDLVWARLMNSTLGAADPDVNPHGFEGALEKDLPEIFERCRALIADRREHPTEDLTSVLVHSEVEGSKLEEHEIVMGFFLLMAAGNDSTKATYCSGMLALMEDREQMQMLIDDPALVPGAVEESLRMSRRSPTSAAPPPATPSCTARRSAPARRWSCGTCRPTATRPASRTRTASTCCAKKTTRRSAPAGGTSASAPHWRAWSCG